MAASVQFSNADLAAVYPLTVYIVCVTSRLTSMKGMSREQYNSTMTEMPCVFFSMIYLLSFFLAQNTELVQRALF